MGDFFPPLVLGIEPSPPCILDKLSTTELCPSLHGSLFKDQCETSGTRQSVFTSKLTSWASDAKEGDNVKESSGEARTSKHGSRRQHTEPSPQ